MSDLEQRARKVLAEASVIAEAGGVSYIPSGKHAHESTDPTTGSGMAVYDYVSDLLRAAEGRGPTSLRVALGKAERAVKDARKGKPKPVLDTKQMVLSQFGGDHYLKVADIVGLHGTTIWRWRVAAGLRGVDGREPDAEVAA
jgi:hypothetical protein